MYKVFPNCEMLIVYLQTLDLSSQIRPIFKIPHRPNLNVQWPFDTRDSVTPTTNDGPRHCKLITKAILIAWIFFFYFVNGFLATPVSACEEHRNSIEHAKCNNNNACICQDAVLNIGRVDCIRLKLANFRLFLRVVFLVVFLSSFVFGLRIFHVKERTHTSASLKKMIGAISFFISEHDRGWNLMDVGFFDHK